MNYVIRNSEMVWDWRVQHKYKTMLTGSLGTKIILMPVSELYC